MWLGSFGHVELDVKLWTVTEGVYSSSQRAKNSEQEKV